MVRKMCIRDRIQIDDVQKMLDEIMDDHVFSVREALMNIINGEDPVSKETVPVSYTHLDVYKRQVRFRGLRYSKLSEIC